MNLGHIHWKWDWKPDKGWICECGLELGFYFEEDE